ncbi:MAG TPA: helix-turn-helix domain-containing protein [Pyrinomonadaceae bacterium]|nr:helix-turn-helix domain-containing protein [Pyrinomonadaceae bacterium]
MIEIRLDGPLGERGRTFYWLAKETGVSHATLWRLKTGRARGITFETLEKICRALACTPDDFILLSNEKKGRARAGGPGGKGRGAGSRKTSTAKRAGAAKGVR